MPGDFSTMSCPYATCNGSGFIATGETSSAFCRCHAKHQDYAGEPIADLEKRLEKAHVPQTPRKAVLSPSLSWQGVDIGKAKKSSLVCLYGLHGRGKTTCATRIFAELLQEHPSRRGLWLDMNEWLVYLKAGLAVRAGEDSRRELETRLYDVIVLDDLTSVRAAAPDQSQGFWRWQDPVARLVRWAEAEGKTLIMTVNLISPETAQRVAQSEAKQGRKWQAKDSDLWPSGLRIIDPSVAARIRAGACFEVTGLNLRAKNGE
jgi:hypothetical protein